MIEINLCIILSALNYQFLLNIGKKFHMGLVGEYAQEIQACQLQDAIIGSKSVISHSASKLNYIEILLYSYASHESLRINVTI